MNTTPQSRYMTALGKTQELQAWEHAKRERKESPPSGFVGGHGYPDPEIYDFVDRLNRISRVCTLQSCAGHKCTPTLMCSSCSRNEFDAAWPMHVWNGQLWLWPDDRLGPWFIQHAPELTLMQPEIEKVSVLWHVEGREIIDIQFRGDGHGTLADSMGIVCSFFERGNRECNLW